MFIAKHCNRDDTPDTIVPLSVNAIDVLYNGNIDFSNLYDQQLFIQKTPIIYSVIREICGPIRHCLYQVWWGAATNIKNSLFCFILRLFVHTLENLF